MKVEFKVLGGGNEIGANSFMLSFDGFNVVVDCGLHPKNTGKEMFPDYERIKDLKVDHLIITHAHNDHIGALPYFLQVFPSAKVHCTKPTLSVAEITLSNTAHLVEKEFESEWDKSFLKYYNEEVLNLIPMIIRQHDFGKRVKLSDKLSFTFNEAGHIIGAASVTFEYDGKRIFFTGDICFRDQALIPKAAADPGHCDVVITECTNGAVENLPAYSSELKRLAKFIDRIVNKGGSVLIPTFALGKAQEMLKRLNSIMEKNKIPRLPFYYSSLAKSLNSVYDDFNYTISRVEKGYKLTGIPIHLVTKRSLRRAGFWKKPSIVLVTSGMVIKDTMSYRIAKEFLGRYNFGIAMCGYCDPETPGYVIKNADKKSRIYLHRDATKPTDVLCEIENFSFSSHASRNDILNLVNESKPKTVLLVHGDEKAIEKVSSFLTQENNERRVISPTKGIVYEL